MNRLAIVLTAGVLCSTAAGRILGAERGFPAALAGQWQMTKLACAQCAPAGVLPADLAGGTITIGPASFDDPLTGACPKPRFEAQTSEAFSHYLAQNVAAGLGPLQRLAPQKAPVLRLTVICEPPPGARIAAGAITPLAFLAPDTLIRPWTDGSYVILKRQPRRDLRGGLGAAGR